MLDQNHLQVIDALASIRINTVLTHMFTYACTSLMLYCIQQNYGWDNFDELAKRMSFTKYFTQLNSRITKVTKC